MTEKEPRLHEKIIRLMSTCDRPLSASEIAERLGWPGGPAAAGQAVESALLGELGDVAKNSGDFLLLGDDE
ncbi:MAG: hypothetical protein HOH43_05815 [Candidatus Latescibacteria bacterium]|jgi:hypothetical protein|nr:hypothetical protein [Candidatus Latescibacterota bacterium]